MDELGLQIDLEGAVPVYRQIADGIRTALAEGRLPAGRRLPPTRDLARSLGVNRNTVVAAYEALAAEGLVRSHTGRGTFLEAATPAAPAVETAPRDPDPWFTAFSSAVEGSRVASLLSVYRVAISSEGISFAGSYPAGDLMPVEGFRRAMNAVLREHVTELLGYGPTAGYGPLREAIAADLRRRGSKVSAESVLVTNGSQQAIELAFRTFVDAGDPVIVEDPTYTGAISVLSSIGARIVGVPGDDDGIRTDLLARALERHKPRVLYLQPTFHNPTARVTVEARRHELLELASRHRCIVVEDDWAGDLRFEGSDLPTLHALDGGRHVLHLGTFSKKLLPGLRIGWVAAPAPALERLLALKQVADCGTSPLLQAALHRFLEEGGLDEHLRRTRRVYRERRDLMLAALDRHLAGAARWTRPLGGLFVWVRLTGRGDGGELFAAAQERGVTFSRGELFHVEGGGRDAMRLTYAAASPEQIETGVRVLGALLREREPRRPEPDRDAVAVPIL